MPQSSAYKKCELCGKPLGEWSWLHTEEDSLHIRSGVVEELTIVHKECASLVRHAITKGNVSVLQLMLS